MNDVRATTAILGSLLALLAAACGPSAAEVRLQKQSEELSRELAEQKQYNQDLKLRMQLAEARNKVLVDLVKGLTSDAQSPSASADANAPLLPAHSSLEALDADLEALVQSVRHSREDMNALRAQREALARELSQAKSTIEAQRSEEAAVKARADAFAAMLSKLSQLIEHDELDVRIARNRMLLQLPESVLFQSGDARVTRSGKELLVRVAEVLKSVDAREFQISGHTDGLPVRYGRYQDNWQLSSARALNVMLYLVEHGVPRERLSAAAHADTDPVADESTPAGRRQNRRIEIVLLPNLEELPDLSALAKLLEKRDATPAEAPAAASTP